MEMEEQTNPESLMHHMLRLHTLKVIVNMSDCKGYSIEKLTLLKQLESIIPENVKSSFDFSCSDLENEPAFCEIQKTYEKKREALRKKHMQQIIDLLLQDTAEHALKLLAEST